MIVSCSGARPFLDSTKRIVLNGLLSTATGATAMFSQTRIRRMTTSGSGSLHTPVTTRTVVRLAVWCDSPEAVASGAELFSTLQQQEQERSLASGRGHHHRHHQHAHDQAGRHSAVFRRLRLNENTFVDLMSPPSISRKRRLFLRKHGGARLVQVDVGTDIPESDEALESMVNQLRMTNLIYQDAPKVIPKLTIQDDQNVSSDAATYLKASDDHGDVFLREVVVGAGEGHEAFEATLQSLYDSTSLEIAGPLLFSVKNTRTIIRILPSSFSAVVFSVPELDEDKEKAHTKRSFTGRVGATGSHRGQIHISSKHPHHLRGLDVRLCAERGKPSMMFAESNEATLENAVDTPQTDNEMSCRGRTALEGRWRISRLWANLGRGR